MTDMLSGQMVEVAAIQRGTQATAAASIGDTVLYVDDVTDFDDAGGRLDITGVQYDYLTCDEPSSTITLASPLTDAVNEDDPVLVLAGSQVAIDRYAVVSIDSGGGDAAWVPLSYDQLWSIQAYDPPLPVLVSGDLSKVVDAPGATNVISADSVSGDPLADLITENSNSTSGTTMPASAAVGDIWLNSPNAYVCTTAYDGGGAIDDWTLVTDPRTLALVKLHVLNFLAADGAANNATAAMTAANGKNTIIGATRTPTASDPGIEGDTWYYYVSGNISAVYTYTSGAWAKRLMRDETIDTLSVGKVSGLDADFLNATIDYLTSVSITSSTITSSDLVMQGSNKITFEDSGGSPVGYIENILSAVGLVGGGAGGSIGVGNGNIFLTGNIFTAISQTYATLNGFSSAAIAATPYSAGNLVRINRANGIVAYDSSGLKHKIDVHRLADAALGSSILGIEPIRYRDRYEVEQRADGHPDFQYEAPWCIGWSAESFADAGWEELIIRTTEGEPDSLHYDRVLPALALEIRDRFDALEAENADLRTQLTDLAAQVAALTNGGTNGAQ